MASPLSKTAATAAVAEAAAKENQASSPRAGNNPRHRSNRRLSSSRSRSPSPSPRRLSAPHSTVGAEGIEGDDLSAPSSPDSNRSSRGSSTGAGAIGRGGKGSREVGRRRFSRHSLRRRSACPSQFTESDGGGNDSGSSKSDSFSSSSFSSSSKSSGARTTRRKGEVVIVDRELVSLRGGVDVDVEPSRAGVRWARRSSAGQQREGEHGKKGDERREGGAGADGTLNSSANGNGTTITFLSDETDDPPVTRPMSGDGESFLRRPGRYTFVVSSGPLTVGRLLVSEEVSKQRRRKPRPAAVKVFSSESSACGDSEEVEAGTDEGCDGNTAVVVIDVNDSANHGPTAAAAAAAAAASTESPVAPSKLEKVVAVAGAFQTFGPPPEEKKEQLEGCSVEDSEKGRSDEDDGGADAGSRGSPNAQEESDVQKQQQQQQQQEEQEEEEEAMAADELSPVYAGKQPQPLGVLGESSAFSPPSRSVAPWRDDRSALEMSQHRSETPVLEEVAPGALSSLPMLPVPPCEPSVTPSTCGGSSGGGVVASGDCKREPHDDAHGPSRPADEARPDPPSPRGEEEAVAPGPEKRCLETDEAARTEDCPSGAAESSRPSVQPPRFLLSRPSESSERAETMMLARPSVGGRGCGVGEVDSDDDPDGILSDNSRIDSDDGTAATSQSGAKGGACEDKVSSSPPPPSPPLPPPLCSKPMVSSLAATDGFVGGAGQSSSLAGAVLEAGAPPFSRCLRTEPVPSSGGGDTTRRAGGLMEQEWHDGMSPLTSPAVGGPGDDGHGGFGCSEAPPPVVLPHGVTKDDAPEEQQGPALTADRGGQDEENEHDVRSAVERAGVLTSEAAATAAIETAVDDGSTIAMPHYSTGEVESAPTVCPVAPPADEDAAGESGEEGRGGTGGQTSLDHEDFPCKLQVWSSEDAGCPNGSDGAGGGAGEGVGGVLCGSETLPANGGARYAVQTSFELGDSDGDDGGPVAVIKMIGDDPAEKSFDPEKTKVSVGTTVVWKLDGAAGPESEVFHVRPECLVIKNGWQTECSFSLRDKQPSFTHTFKKAGVFMVFSVTSPLDDDHGEEKGRIVVERTESMCDSDSFDPTDTDSLDNIQPGSETPPSGNDDSSGSFTSSKRDSERSAATRAEVARSSDPNLSDCPVGGKRSASSVAQDVGAAPPVHAEVPPRGLLESSPHTYRPVGPSALLPPGTEMDIFAATAAARAGASKSKTKAGSHRNIAPIQGTPVGYGGGCCICCRSGSKSETAGGKDNADVDGGGLAHPEALVAAPRPPRVNAAVQSGELFWPQPGPDSATTEAEDNSGASAGRQPAAASPKTPIGDGTDEDERIGHATEAASKSKKKKKKMKKKKKKKKSGSGGGGGGDGVPGGRGGRGGGGEEGSRGTGWDVRQGGGFDASKVGGGIMKELALLLDERTFSSLFPDRAVGVKGGAGGKSMAKTLIVGDEGFKPAKALVVQAEDAVSIKAAAVRRNGGYGHERALSISLELPVVHPSKHFFQDSPRQNVVKKNNSFGQPLVAVFRASGEYWLVDHLSGKRLKVTATERPEDATHADAITAAAELHHSAASGKGGKDRRAAGSSSGSLLHNAESCAGVGGETTSFSSRTKKKSKGKERSAAATATAAAAAAAALAADVVASSTTEALDRTQVEGVSAVSDEACGAGAPTSAGTTPPASPPPPPLLAPVRVKQGGDGPSVDAVAEHEEAEKKSPELGGVRAVAVSHRRGFQPARLEVGLTPGLGACVLCELEPQQRVTREVVCRRLVSKAAGGSSRNSSSADAAGYSTVTVGGVGDGLNSFSAAKDGEQGWNDTEDEEQDDPNVRTARLGPGLLKKCYFILGRYGEYRIFHRNEENKGMSVVVKSLPPASEGGEGEGSASDDRVSLEDDALSPSSSGKAKIAGKGGRRDSGEAESSGEDNGTAESGSTIPEVITPLECAAAAGDGGDSPSSRPMPVNEGPFVSESLGAAVATVAATTSSGFSLGSTTANSDHAQGGFVHQRAQKKNNMKKLKRDSATAAAASARGLSATKEEVAVAGVAVAEGVDQTGAIDPPPTESFLRPPPDSSAENGDTVAHKSVGETPPTSGTWGVGTPTKARCPEDDTSAGSVADGVSSSPPAGGVGSGDVNSKTTRSAPLEGHQASRTSGSKIPDSGSRSSSPMVRAPSQKTTQRNVEAGKEGHGRLGRAGWGDEISGAASTTRESSPSLPTAAVPTTGENLEDKVQEGQAATHPVGAALGTAMATGGRDPVTQASWGGEQGATAPSKGHGRVAASVGRNLSRGGARPRAGHSRGVSLSRSWENPPTGGFAGPRPPQMEDPNVHGKEEWSAAPSVSGVAVSTAEGGGFASTTGFSAAPAGTDDVGSRRPKPDHAGDEAPSAWDRSASRTAPTAVLPSAAPVPSRTQSPYSHRPVAEAAEHSPPPNGGSAAQRLPSATTVSTEAPPAAAREASPRPGLGSGPSTVLVSSEKGSGSSGRAKSVVEGSSTWSSSRTNAVDGRSRAPAVSSERPDSTSPLSTSSASGPKATTTGGGGSSSVGGDSSMSNNKRKKLTKKAKQVARRAARREAEAASAAEEPTPAPSGTADARVSASSSAWPPDPSSPRPQPSVAAPPVMAAACSLAEAPVGSASVKPRMAVTISAPLCPANSLGNSAPVGQVSTALGRVNGVSRPTASSTSTVPASPAVSARGGAAYDESPSDRGNIPRASSSPASSPSGRTRVTGGYGGQANENGVAVDVMEHVARDSGSTAGAGRGSSRGEQVCSPPPGLARSRSEADTGRGGAATVAAVGGVPPVPAAAPLVQMEAQALLRPPLPGLPRDYHGTHAIPRGGGRPAAATTAAVTDSKPTPAGRATTLPTVNPAAVPASKPIHQRGTDGGGGGGEGRGSGDGSGACDSGTQSPERLVERKFGNCSTKVSFEERLRRSRVLRAEAPAFYPASHARKGTARATPAVFPKESRLPDGGYYVEERPDDTLPPPSPYEVQEAARMFRVYDEMMERLRTTGMDETLPNGFTPRIYDFTAGGC